MPLTLTRSLLTIIIPGIVACSPWLLLLLDVYDPAASWYANHPFPFHTVSFACVVVVGTVFEGIGTYLEKSWDRERGMEPEPEQEEDWVERDWYDYLTTRVASNEPVGYRYISRKVTALYFELGMMFAAPIGLLGFGILLTQTHAPYRAIGITLTVAVAITVLFRKFARDTHGVLCESRWYVNRRLKSCETDSES